jgi:hypothetical protein
MNLLVDAVVDSIPLSATSSTSSGARTTGTFGCRIRG